MHAQRYKWITWMQASILVICLALCSCIIGSTPCYSQSLEICDNALDDDGDGLIDLNDPDCVCETLEPISYIPNPSFEDMDCCPQARNELYCATSWAQASEPTTDFIHNCGWPGWDQFPPPKPFPDGDGIMGLRDGRLRQTSGEIESNWKEYAGACLTNPLLKGVPYRFEFHVGFHSPEASPPIAMTFYGTSDCQYLPFGQGNSGLGCPTNGPNWTRLASTKVPAAATSTRGWVKALIEITPHEDIYAIAIGPPCRSTLANVSTYYFFDNLVLADAKSFDFRIAENGHLCHSDFKISVVSESNAQYQWYKNGIALIGETDASLSLDFNEGNYQVRVVKDGFCGLSKLFNYSIPVLSEVTSRVICSGEQIILGQQVLSRTGVYHDTLPSVNLCDSIVELTLNVRDQAADTLHAKIFKGEVYEEITGFTFSEAGIHTLSLPTSIGCDSLILLNLAYYQVYIPTVFSPNNDGINDWFTILGSDDLVEIRNLTLFDRWGTQIYQVHDQRTNGLLGWNGEHNNELVTAGVYIYLATVEMDDGIRRQFSGNVMVVE